MSYSVLGELERMRKHQKWVELRVKALRSRASDTQAEADNPPQYKDCKLCPYRASCNTPEERQEMCADCPWADLPASPPERFLWVWELARLPAECVDARELRYDDARDLWSLRRELNPLG